MIDLLYNVGELAENPEASLKHDTFFMNTICEAIQIFEQKYLGDKTTDDKNYQDVTTIIKNKILKDVHSSYVFIVLINNINSNGIIVFDVVETLKEKHLYDITVEEYIDNIEGVLLSQFNEYSNIYLEIQLNCFKAKGKIKQMYGTLKAYEGKDQEEEMLQELRHLYED